MRHVIDNTSTHELASISSALDTDYHTADRSTSHRRTDTVAVVSRTALEDALLAQTPTAPDPRHLLVVPTCPPVDAAEALHRAETPTADVHLLPETGTRRPEAATAIEPALVLRLL